MNQQSKRAEGLRALARMIAVAYRRQCAAKREKNQQTAVAGGGVNNDKR